MDNLSHFSDMLTICRKNHQYLMRLPSVQGVGVGFKSINGIETDILCFHVFVDRKLSPSNIPLNLQIPKYYMGFPTDIIETGVHYAHGLNDRIRSLQDRYNIGDANNDRIRPLQGGYSVSAANSTSFGTIGCIVSKGSILKKEYFLLSNNHIIAGENKFKIGTDIVQPAHVNGGEAPKDSVARLSEFIPIKFKTAISTPANYMDCAIARLNNKSLVSANIHSIGKVKGVDDPKLKSNIRKCGASTGVTHGTITSFGVVLDVKYDDHKIARFLNLFKTNLKSEDGDSGSVIVDNNNKVVGLLIAGGENSTVFTAIKPILDVLEVSIYT